MGKMNGSVRRKVRRRDRCTGPGRRAGAKIAKKARLHLIGVSDRSGIAGEAIRNIAIERYLRERAQR